MYEFPYSHIAMITLGGIYEYFTNTRIKKSQKGTATGRTKKKAKIKNVKIQTGGSRTGITNPDHCPARRKPFTHVNLRKTGQAMPQCCIGEML